MKNIQIFTDSSCDTPDAILKKHAIKRVPFYVSFDQEHYFKEIEELSISDFYKRLTSEKIYPKTSLPSVQDYINYFTEALENNMDILCFCLTSKFSGSYQSATTAKSILLEDYPDAHIVIFNTIQATSCQGLTVLQGVYMKEAGYTLNQIEESLHILKNTSRIMFTVGTLEYLQRGGRIGKVSSLAGTILNLKPLITLKEGELIPYGTIRGRNKALSKTVAMVKEYFDENNESYDDYDFVVTTGTSIEEADKVKLELENLIGRKIDYPIFTIGVTIGTNTGPDAIGCCFIKKYTAIS